MVRELITGNFARYWRSVLGSLFTISLLSLLIFSFLSIGRVTEGNLRYASSQELGETSFQLIDSKQPVGEILEKIQKQKEFSQFTVDVKREAFALNTTQASAIRINSFTSQTAQKLPLQKGNYPENIDEIIVSSELAETLKLNLGQNLTLLINHDSSKYLSGKITGIFKKDFLAIEPRALEVYSPNLDFILGKDWLLAPLTEADRINLISSREILSLEELAKAATAISAEKTLDRIKIKEAINAELLAQYQHYINTARWLIAMPTLLAAALATISIWRYTNLHQPDFRRLRVQGFSRKKIMQFHALELISIIFLSALITNFMIRATILGIREESPLVAALPFVIKEQYFTWGGVLVSVITSCAVGLCCALPALFTTVKKLENPTRPAQLTTDSQWYSLSFVAFFLTLFAGAITLFAIVTTAQDLYWINTFVEDPQNFASLAIVTGIVLFGFFLTAFAKKAFITENLTIFRQKNKIKGNIITRATTVQLTFGSLTLFLTTAIITALWTATSYSQFVFDTYNRQSEPFDLAIYTTNSEHLAQKSLALIYNHPNITQALPLKAVETEVNVEGSATADTQVIHLASLRNAQRYSEKISSEKIATQNNTLLINQSISPIILNLSENKIQLKSPEHNLFITVAKVSPTNYFWTLLLTDVDSFNGIVSSQEVIWTLVNPQNPNLAQTVSSLIDSFDDSVSILIQPRITIAHTEVNNIDIELLANFILYTTLAITVIAITLRLSEVQRIKTQSQITLVRLGYPQEKIRKHYILQSSTRIFVNCIGGTITGAVSAYYISNSLLDQFKVAIFNEFPIAKIVILVAITTIISWGLLQLIRHIQARTSYV